MASIRSRGTYNTTPTDIGHTRGTPLFRETGRVERGSHCSAAPLQRRATAALHTRPRQPANVAPLYPQFSRGTSKKLMYMLFGAMPNSSRSLVMSEVTFLLLSRLIAPRE